MPSLEGQARFSQNPKFVVFFVLKALPYISYRLLQPLPPLQLVSLGMEVLPTILMEAAATHTGVLRVFMDTMVGMDTLARGQLRLSPGMDMVMDMELLLSMSPRLTMDMDTTLPITLMDMILDMDMARGLLTPSPDTVMVML